jgi:hypothetical protein
VRQIEQVHTHAARHERFAQMLHHALRAGVHGGVGEDGPVLGLVGHPLPVGVEDKPRPAQHRAVAGADHLEGQCFDPGQVGLDAGAMGHHQLGEVALGGGEDDAVAGGRRLAGRQVSPEEIAGEEHPVLGQPGEHRLRPVDPGKVEEVQGLAAERQGGPVLDRQEAVGRQLEQLGEQVLALRRGDDPRRGEALQQMGEGAGVVLLGVVRDHVVEPRDPEAGEALEQDAGEAGVDRVDECGLLGALDQVGVVGRAVGGRDQLVEQTSVPVDRPDPVDSRLQRAAQHCARPPRLGEG